ncbi:Flp pilus assembly complex ATPase component TadA [Lysinibacillus xylanilyticus]|uniref:ATPase, T2SS/T4P/T4SS family n=1 Tax=Lysinibacillus xylanilyticus TaxID=582475 RepID=UPI002B248A46|nr:ATPase, T2SS/T4P/T4SS family [Lysinibacillus xylanilyticus]MEB2280150.1 Flp pilus assembly complex ATPase component TadA [Lysinibacillus xylanilyticus]
MSYSLNLLIIIGILSLILFLILLKLVQAKKDSNSLDVKKVVNKEEYSVEALQDYISEKMIANTTGNLYEEGLTEEAFNRKKRRRNELRDALKNCNTGNLSAKILVREYIYDFLKKDKKIDETTINFAIPFNVPSKMTPREKFDTALYVVYQTEEYNALGWIIETFKLNEPKEDGGYRVLADEVDNIYEQVVLKYPLRLEDKVRILSQRIYSHYKGFGIIDEIRDMNIDGTSGGVSGLPERLTSLMNNVDPYYLDEENDPKIDEAFVDHVSEQGNFTALNSAWVMYRGKSIHFSFLSFEAEAELRRVTNNVYKYGYPGQLSETKPAIINEMADGSRVTVMRPKLTETWAYFIRKKYNSRKVSVEELFQQENSNLLIILLMYLVKGNRTLALTGSQGSGKTTLLMALVEYINSALNLRVHETKFELNLRNQYSRRNILSFQETETYSGQDGLDLGKKTDGDVTILGEVATDPVAAWMIQSAQVASLFTWFTHHAKTFPDLVFSLRNSLLKTNMFNDEKIAEQQVVSVLEFDIHMRQDKSTGERYVERITECVAITYQDEKSSFEALKNSTDRESKMDLLINLASNFFHQKTQTQQFVENTILEFKDGKYVAVNRISDKKIEDIKLELSKEDREQFDFFINEFWGA